MAESAIPAYITSLIRHFENLRDGTHGVSPSRKGREAHCEKTVQLPALFARRVLTEMNTSLLLDTGQFTETGMLRTPAGGLNTSWELSRPEQQAAGVSQIDAAAQLSILRANAFSDLHNLVCRADYRIVPAMNANPAARQDVEQC
jgi:hypothetical protein